MNLAALHPQIVHFTIVLVIIGVAFRWLSLLGVKFAGPAATTLLVLAAVSSVGSVRSGTAAHGPVERVPGSRPAVVEHEEWGERTQTVLLVLGVIELAALVLRRSPRAAMVRGLAAVVGLVGVYSVYETSEHGGALVYSYAGGIGLRTGEPKDVERLLLAGYYHQAMADRKAGHSDQAAALIDAAMARFGSDPELQLLAAESKLIDRRNPQEAIDALATLEVPAPLRVRRVMLQADAFEAAGQPAQAIVALEAAAAQTPNQRVQQRLDALKAKAGTAR